MKWVEVTAEFAQAPPDWSLIHDVFGRFGGPNTMQTDDPATMVGSLAGIAGFETGLADLRGALAEVGAVKVRTRIIPDQDWMDAFRRHFTTLRVGKRFVVVPSWQDFAPAPEDLLITLDPGQAFGTGDHPTTRMCIELLESAEVAGKRVLDVGCGTGILSIAAVLLGASEVAGGDIDALSIEVARENMVQNGVSFRAEVAAGLAGFGREWDVVVSNIVSATLIHLAQDIAVATRPGGRWMLSGVIHDNWPDVLSAAQAAGFALREKREDEQWVAAVFQKT